MHHAYPSRSAACSAVCHAVAAPPRAQDVIVRHTGARRCHAPCLPRPRDDRALVFVRPIVAGTIPRGVDALQPALVRALHRVHTLLGDTFSTEARAPTQHSWHPARLPCTSSSLVTHGLLPAHLLVHPRTHDPRATAPVNAGSDALCRRHRPRPLLSASSVSFPANRASATARSAPKQRRRTGPAVVKVGPRCARRRPSARCLSMFPMRAEHSVRARCKQPRHVPQAWCSLQAQSGHQ